MALSRELKTLMPRFFKTLTIKRLLENSADKAEDAADAARMLSFTM